MKTLSDLKYKYILPLLALAVVGCADDPLMRTPDVFDTDYVGYAATVWPAGSISSNSRSEASAQSKTLYEPLVLNSDSEEFPLYLHTWVHAMGDEYQAQTADDATAPQSRAMQVDSPQSLIDVHGNFGVNAFDYTEGSTYFAMQKARQTGTSAEYWTTDRTQRWPGTHRLDFSAVAPFNHLDEVKNLAYDHCALSFSYTAQKSDNKQRDAEAQPDLMVASSSFTREETEEYNYRVPLPFNHALSAIKFAVRDVLAGEVVSISIKGVHGSGNCHFSADQNGQNGVVTWSDLDNVTEYTQLFNHKIANGNFDPTDESQDVVLNDKMPEKTFMLIPQEIPDDATIEVVIKRDNVVAPLAETITVRGKIKDNLVTEWLPGHEYVYTISTSKDNWVYVFEVKGNEAEGYDNIHVYHPNHPEFVKEGMGNTAYYSIKSMRYRANDQTYQEILPWDGSFAGSESYYNQDRYIYPHKWIDPSKWIEDLDAYKVDDKSDTSLRKISGLGSKTFEKHRLNFYPHYLKTTWIGDIEMQKNPPFKNNSKTNPYDLSTFGGKRNRTTANCYVVDRGGWYCLPLVYGNAIDNGSDNTSSYKYTGTSNSYILKTFVDYLQNPISKSKIVETTTGYNATLVWEDAYNVVTTDLVSLEMKGDMPMLKFFVDKDNLQQGNAIVALRDGQNRIMWSWHIWFTEHWLVADDDTQPTTALPNAYATSEPKFNYDYEPLYGDVETTDGDIDIDNNNHMRRRGDATLKNSTYLGTYTYRMSPYNLGWCDAKNVQYLSRKSTMNFVQYMPDGKTPTRKVAHLPIKQEGITVEYKIGNNTYYQFGRKDPMVGFASRESNYKKNFGPIPYDVQPQWKKTIAHGIRNPHILYVGYGDYKYNAKTDSADHRDYQDWTINRYSNLWNNSSTTGGYTSSGYKDAIWDNVKTVYDPCPAGYMIPNAGVWRIIGKGYDWTGHPNYTGTTTGDKLSYYKEANFDKYFNGVRINCINADKVKNIYTYKIWGNGANNDVDAVYLVPTGNRWYSNFHTLSEDKPGDVGQTLVDAGYNLNLRIAYAWSSHWITEYAAYGVAVGIDKPQANTSGFEEYFLAAHFTGRRAMGRPVRPIRDPNAK